MPLDALLRLFPSVARSAPAGVVLAGEVQAAGHVRREHGEARADARVELRRAGVKTAALTLEGDAGVVASLRAPAGAGTLAVEADLDAAKARVIVPGRVDKAAGAPLAIHVAAERAGAITTVREARIALDGAAVKGTVRYDAAAHALRVDAPSCDLDLGALSRTIPALGVVPAAIAGARVHAAVSCEGDPRDPATAHLRLTQLDLAAPVGHVRGIVDLQGLSPPRRIAFDLDGDSVDLDAVDHARTSGGVSLTSVAVDGKLRVGRLHVRDMDARDVVAEVGLDKGVADLRTLRFSLLGGAFTANGSRVDLSRVEPAITLRARVEHLDLSALPASHWSRGHLDADLALDGQGTTWAALAPTLAGTAGLDVTDAHVHSIFSLRGTILNPLLRKLAEKSKEKHPVREMDMTLARASLKVRVGNDQATTLTPARVETEDGKLTVDGTVGFDGRLALGALAVIPAAAFRQTTGGRLAPLGDVPVTARVTGTSSAPEVEFVDLDQTMKALAGAGVHALGLKLAGLFEH